MGSAWTGSKARWGLVCLGVLCVAGLRPALSWADDRPLAAPECPAYGHDLPLNNEQVLHWKRTTNNQFQERAHVEGQIVRLFPDATGHHHFEIQIGHGGADTIEVIYNEDFGKLPPLRKGVEVEACGDYITAKAQSGPYPPSPAGAIVHWVHANPDGKGHPPGFLVVDGALCGQDTQNAGPGGHHGGHGGGDGLEGVDDQP
jgi:hypothetical protein